MNSNTQQKDISSILYIVDFIFSLIGLIFYLISFILFNFYYKCPSLIKLEIFTFIFIYSVKTILIIILPPSMINILINYILKIILFYLIIVFLNKCLSSKKLSQNSINFEIIHKDYLYSIFFVSSFPLTSIFNLTKNYIIVENVLNIFIAIIIYRYIKNKFLILLGYLNEKKATNSKIPDIYLPYMKAYYYYISFNLAYKLFFFSFIIILFYYSMNILFLLLNNLYLRCLSILFEKISGFLLILGCLILFYSLYKKFLGIGKNEEIEEDGINISNFTVIDVDIQQDEKEENSGLTIRKKYKKEIKNKDDDNNYVKIEGEEIKEKEKNNNSKINEEAESLNK